MYYLKKPECSRVELNSVIVAHCYRPAHSKFPQNRENCRCVHDCCKVQFGFKDKVCKSLEKL